MHSVFDQWKNDIVNFKVVHECLSFRVDLVVGKDLVVIDNFGGLTKALINVLKEAEQFIRCRCFSSVNVFIQPHLTLLHQ